MIDWVADASLSYYQYENGRVLITDTIRRERRRLSFACIYLGQGGTERVAKVLLYIFGIDLALST
jgi:hypothetical protein